MLGQLAEGAGNGEAGLKGGRGVANRPSQAVPNRVDGRSLRSRAVPLLAPGRRVSSARPSGRSSCHHRLLLDLRHRDGKQRGRACLGMVPKASSHQVLGDLGENCSGGDTFGSMPLPEAFRLGTGTEDLVNLVELEALFRVERGERPHPLGGEHPTVAQKENPASHSWLHQAGEWPRRGPAALPDVALKTSMPTVLAHGPPSGHGIPVRVVQR